MWSWQVILALLALAWMLQCWGTFVQIRRYRDAFRHLSSQYSDGWMGAGKSGGGFRRGAIVMAVAAPDGTLRRVVALQGRTIFAHFQPIARFEGLSLAQARASASAEAQPKRPLERALLTALDQIETVRRGPTPSEAADLTTFSPSLA